jgi:hypothetical protein
MDNNTFETLLYNEWRKNHLNKYIQNNIPNSVWFDMLWDIAQTDKLYTIFYPLGISSNGIHDTCAVADDCKYTEDDGELTIVGYYYKTTKDFFGDSMLELLKNNGIEYNSDILKERFDFFVCRGFYNEIDEKHLFSYAMQHRSKFDYNVVKFVTKDFNINVLKELHNLTPRFKKELELTAKTDLYFSHRKETSNIVENIIINL